VQTLILALELLSLALLAVVPALLRGCVAEAMGGGMARLLGLRARRGEREGE